MDVLKERKKKIKDILTPHILYGKLSEEQIVEMIRIESADYKNKSAGKMGELRSEIERRRLLRLRRLNPDEFDRRIDIMLERPSKDVNEKRTRLPRGLTPMQEKFCMQNILHPKGHYVEFGVFEGKSINYLASLNKNITFHALIALKDYLNSGLWGIKS